MAKFDSEKDKVLKSWRCEETGLVVAIHSYNGGEAKLQIGPRMLKRKTSPELVPGKAGRLTMEDLEWLYNIIDEVKDSLEEANNPLG